MKIDKISCLCLDKRWKSQGMALCTDVLYKLHSPIEPFIAGDGTFGLEYDHIDIFKPPFAQFNYGTLETINHHYNAFVCHRKMVQRAIDEKRENLLLLEDDAYLTDRFKDVWDRVHHTLDEVEWDLCYLGWWMERPNTPDANGDNLHLEELWAEKNLCGIDRVPRPPAIKQEICGLHGLLVNKSVFHLMANAPWGPMDSFLTTHLNKLKAYYVWPKIIHVGPGWSYCENSYTQRAKW